MHSLLTITWDMTRGIDLGFLTIRFYSLLFALGFVLGYLLMKNIFKKEGIPQEKLDTLLTYVVIATIVGARLGHVFFYQWDYYSQHPGEILKVWEGGLASHGAAIAIVLAIVIYCKRVLHKSPLWMLDRVVLTIALAGCLIRVGNWFNSEIYGAIENSPVETVFTDPTRERVMANFDNVIEAMDFKELNEAEITDSIIYPVYLVQFQVLPQIDKAVAERVISGQVMPYVNSFDSENKNVIFNSRELSWDMDKANLVTVKALGVPRHPTQLYEALAYFLIFLILYRLFINKKLAKRQGFLFGMFLILVFGFRFFIEFYKEVQVSAEIGRTLNNGQYLSIPLVLIGLYFAIAAKTKKE